MKKAISIISVSLVIIMIASMLSACAADKKFVGTWKEEGSDCIMVLASDGTGSIKEDGISGSVNWTVEGDKVFLNLSVCGMSETVECTYNFSGDTMTLIEADGETTVYHKVK